MSIVGTISAVKEDRLNEFISKPDGNTNYGEELYLDKFFWDINYVLTEFFEDKEKVQNKDLIYGARKISDMNKGDEIHYAYSRFEDTKELSKIIQKYSKEKFEKHLDEALNNSNSIINCYFGDESFKEATLMLFEQLKSLYDNAEKNDLSVIYVYG